ncbi:MAG: hypothetical protein RIF41_17550 [Polyangiaceae bacterium]
MPYRIDPDRDRQRRAELLDRHAANRRRASALADELTTMGARSRALREQLDAMRREQDDLERQLAEMAGQPLPEPPPPLRREGPDAAHEARSGALFFGLAVAGAAALVTAVALIGTRTIASAALADGWGRWGLLAMRMTPTAPLDPLPIAVDQQAMHRAFDGSHDDGAHGTRCGERPLVLDRSGDVRVLDRDAMEAALAADHFRRSPVRPTGDGDLHVRAGVGSLLHELGFRTGDRLESINGVDQRDPERARQADESARHDPLIEVRIRRDGRAKHLLFAFNRI